MVKISVSKSAILRSDFIRGLLLGFDIYIIVYYVREREADP
jgi:hypothetical protein